MKYFSFKGFYIAFALGWFIFAVIFNGLILNSYLSLSINDSQKRDTFLFLNVAIICFLIPGIYFVFDLLSTIWKRKTLMQDGIKRSGTIVDYKAGMMTVQKRTGIKLIVELDEKQEGFPKKLISEVYFAPRFQINPPTIFKKGRKKDVYLSKSKPGLYYIDILS